MGDKWSDRQFVMERVQLDGRALQNVSGTLLNDQGIVLAALGAARPRDIWTILSLAKGLRNDKAVALAAVNKNANTLMKMSERLRDDKDVVMKAVQKDGRALEFASDALRDDEEVVRKAVEGDPYWDDALQYASNRLRNDREFMLPFFMQQNARALRHASDSLRNDKKFMLPMVQVDGMSLRYASDGLKNDRNVVLAAVAQNPDALQYASMRLRGDVDFAMAALNINTGAYRHILEAAKPEIRSLYRYRQASKGTLQDFEKLIDSINRLQFEIDRAQTLLRAYERRKQPPSTLQLRQFR